MSNAFTVTSFVALALLLPTTLALPFDLKFWQAKSFATPAYAGDDRPGHWHPSPKPYTTYTMTTSSDASFPTASGGHPSGIFPTAPSGYVGATGTGTAVYPTGTGWAKRDLHGRAEPSAGSTGSPFELLWYDYPAAFPTAFPTATGSSSGHGAGHKVYTAPSKPHGGPRKSGASHYYPLAPGSSTSAAGTAAPTVTAATTTAPCTETGYPVPTGTW